MNSKERDAHLAQQTADIGRIAAAAELPERRRRAESRNASFPPPRLLFGGERGAVALLRSILGFAQLWDRAVPDGYLDRVRSRDGALWWIVNCSCGEHPALRPGAIADCTCGKWFFATGCDVRVKTFEAEAA